MLARHEPLAPLVVTTVMAAILPVSGKIVSAMT
jgi:hypothetical protein